MAVERVAAGKDKPDHNKVARIDQEGRWRASCASWITDMCMPGGRVYGFRRCHGAPIGPAERRTVTVELTSANLGRGVRHETVELGCMVIPQIRTKGGAEEAEYARRAVEAAAEMSAAVGIPVGQWYALSEAIAAREDLRALLIARDLLPRRPGSPVQAERERRSGITEAQRQANAEALAASMGPA